jgi:nicotinamidase-related amidase
VLELDRRTVLLPIDVQRGFDDARWGRRNNPAMEANGLAVLAAWRAAGLPIVHVRHDSLVAGSPLAPGQAGNAFRAGFEPATGEALVTKSVNSAFIGTDLSLRLARLDAKSLVVFGITTDMCVSTTVRMASNLGYRTFLVGDACACFGVLGSDGIEVGADDVHRAHLATLHAEFARVVSAAAVVEALDSRVPAPA